MFPNNYHVQGVLPYLQVYSPPVNIHPHKLYQWKYLLGLINTRVEDAQTIHEFDRLVLPCN